MATTRKQFVSLSSIVIPSSTYNDSSKPSTRYFFFANVKWFDKD